jgi:2-polyprenyl-6-methoxyphenol hydroxylase-like FAD-dependent oxidoreductase
LDSLEYGAKVRAVERVMRKYQNFAALIVGGGPVGLSLAADLGRRGVDVLLIERRSQRLGPARMLEVGVRTMEFCRQLGIVDEVRNWGFPASHSLDSVFVTNLNGYELSRLKVSTLATNRSSSASPERTVPCPQTWFDPIVKRCAQSFPTVELRYQRELVDFRQDREGLTAMVRDTATGAQERIRAAYMIGCDGADSTVRHLLGIQVRGRPHIDWLLNVYMRILEFLSPQQDAPGLSLCVRQPNRNLVLFDHGRWQGPIPTPTSGNRPGCSRAN